MAVNWSALVTTGDGGREDGESGGDQALGHWTGA